MPVYTYQCDSCGVRFDRTQKFSDPPLTRCPECGKKDIRKIFTPVGIIFKGSGFYATDHRSPSGTARSHADEKGSDSTSSAAAKPAEGSTAAKTESSATTSTTPAPAASSESK